MKANQEQYEAAVKIYDERGQSAVVEFAIEIGVDEESSCHQCETETPDYEQDTATRCLICGSHK